MSVLRLGIILSTFVIISSPVHAGNPLEGKKVWEKHACPSCHGKDGIAVIPNVPSFAKGDRMIKSDRRLIVTITNGSRLMPSWKGILTSKQMANVVTYIRTLRKT